MSDLFAEVLTRGINASERLEKTLDTIFEEKDIASVYFVGCGGSLGVMLPSKLILSRYSDVVTDAYNASEFLYLPPHALGDDSLVVLSSYSGSTKETVASCKLARERGAATIALAGEADSPLGHAAEYVFANDADTGVTDSKLIVLYQIVFYILQKLGDIGNYAELKADLASLVTALPEIRKLAAPDAPDFVKSFKDQPFIMVAGAGLLWGEAYTYATCILEEMQWKIAQPVPAGEFFHGAFEIMTDDAISNLLIYHGDDGSRPITQRVIDFAEKHIGNYHVIDIARFPLPEIPAERRHLYAPFVALAVTHSYSEQLAEARNHPLKTRRYMGLVEY